MAVVPTAEAAVIAAVAALAGVVEATTEVVGAEVVAEAPAAVAALAAVAEAPTAVAAPAEAAVEAPTAVAAAAAPMAAARRRTAAINSTNCNFLGPLRSGSGPFSFGASASRPVPAGVSLVTHTRVAHVLSSMFCLSS